MLAGEGGKEMIIQYWDNSTFDGIPRLIKEGYRVIVSNYDVL